MKPVRLQMVGIRSWKTERELNFESIDLAAVIGPTGAGKSSILEAIVYALYNASTFDRRGVGSLISSDGKTMSVTLDFEANDDRWRVTRSISRNNYPPSVHKLSCLTSPADHPMIEGERAVNSAIEALIGLDLDQFLTAVLLPQGRFQTLLMATAGERAGILKGVFRLDELDEIRERAVNVRRDQVEPALEAKQGDRAQLLRDPEATLVEAAAEVERCTATVRSLAELKERHDGLIKRASELEAASSQIRRHVAVLEAGAKSVPSLEQLVELDHGIAEREEALKVARQGHVSKRVEAQTKLGEAASAGATVESLAAAVQVLGAAQVSLPVLDDDERALQEAVNGLSERKRTLEDEERKHAEQIKQHSALSEALSGLKKGAEEARGSLEMAAEALRNLRHLDEQAAHARADLTDTETKFAAATETAEAAAAKAGSDRIAAERAEMVLDAARREHQAAHLAAGLHAGESCPICQRELPHDFAPPESPNVLNEAEQEARRLRVVADGSGAASAKAGAGAEALEEQLKARRSAVETAIQWAHEGRKLAEEKLGTTDLQREDEEILEPLRQLAASAQSAHSDAEQEVAAIKARIDAATENLEQRRQAVTVREKELQKEAARIAREQTTHTTALSGLPKEYAPETFAPDALADASERCSARLDELRLFQEQVQSANTSIELVDSDLAALVKERAENVDGPRREAVADARELAAKVTELQPEAPLKPQPSDSAPMSEHVSWVAEMIKQSLETATALKSKAAEQETERAEATNAAEAIIEAANQLLPEEEEEIAFAEALSGRLDAWRARLLAAERERDKAAHQIPKAASLDAEIVKLRNRRAAFEEVARLLGDSQFIKWLVDRRQQLLLVVASEIFAGMTDGRYRFAADFTVIDGRTGISRHPRTLSGGESFMASLALALGMAEIAARSGGRIGSLYLDEGFGALDPNALDEAITALELRARGGQMILIVSHVPAVAQRIERVLQVHPDATGSTAEWLDDEDRESVLVEAASTEVP